MHIDKQLRSQWERLKADIRAFSEACEAHDDDIEDSPEIEDAGENYISEVEERIDE